MTPRAPKHQPTGTAPRVPWAGSTRRASLPRGWRAIRQSVLDRDGHQCTWAEDGPRCTEKATDVDHLGDRNDHRPHMLRSLCRRHHLTRTGRQAAAARPSTRRRDQPHPGLVP